MTAVATPFERSALAVDLYRAGHRTREVAEMVGVSTCTVLRALHKAGVPVRPACFETRTCKYTSTDPAERTRERKRAYAAARKQLGLCVLCGAPAQGQCRLCAEHLVQERDRNRRRVAERVQQGVCCRCDRPIACGSLCEVHRTHNGLVSRARRLHDPTQPPYVYFIQEGSDGPIKIGRCRCDPLVRLKELQIGNPASLELLAVVRDGRFREDDLHRQFAHLRVRGEWFRPDVELYAFMLSVLDVLDRGPS